MHYALAGGVMGPGAMALGTMRYGIVSAIGYHTRTKEDKMQTYGEFAPTTFDPKGLNLPDQQDWLVAPVGRNRDNEDEPLTASNWEAFKAALNEVDSDGESWEEHSFNHWGVGWFEIILIKPDTLAAEAAIELEKALEDYPILDDDDHSSREFEATCEAWESYSLSDRIDLCKRAGVSIFRAKCQSPYDADPGNGAITDSLLGH